MKLTLLRLNFYSCEFIKVSHINGTRIAELAKILLSTSFSLIDLRPGNCFFILQKVLILKRFYN